VLGQRSITDWVTAVLAAATIVVLWKFKKVQEPFVIAVAALAGLLLFPLMK
jgi:chromate transporter